MLFPDVKGFRAPDRSMSATDARVGQRLAQGMGITEATKEDVDASTMAESNMMVRPRRGLQHALRRITRASLLAFERTKLIPRSPAAIDLTAMIAAAGADTVDKVVDHFAPPVSVRDRSQRRSAPLLVDFLRGKLGATDIRPGEKLEELAPRAAVSRRLEHAVNIKLG